MLIAAAVSFGTSASAIAPQNGIAALVQQDARLATIGWRLATRNRSLCADTRPRAGWALHSLAQYETPQRAAVQRLWRIDGRPAIAAVVSGGAADRAGIRAGDVLVVIDGVAFASSPLDRPASYRPLADALAQVDSALDDGVARVELERDGRRLHVEMRGDPACVARFEVRDGNDMQARADGLYVQVESGLLAATPDDGEAAAAVAHELAHNILCHRARLSAQGIDPSRRRQSRAARAAIRRTEREADLLSLTLLANAGYEPAAATRLWARLGRERRRRSGTHPAPADRIAVLTGEAQRLTALRAAGSPIAPPPEATPGNAPCAVSISQR